MVENKNSAYKIKRIESENKNELTNDKCDLNKNDENAKRYQSGGGYEREDCKNTEEHKRMLKTYAGALKKGLCEKNTSIEEKWE